MFSFILVFSLRNLNVKEQIPHILREDNYRLVDAFRVKQTQSSFKFTVLKMLATVPSFP